MTDPGHIDWYPTDEERAEVQVTPTSITQFWMDRIISERQAEAVAAERARIRAAVEGRKVRTTRPAEADWARGFRDGWNDAIGSILADIDEDASRA